MGMGYGTQQKQQPYGQATGMTGQTYGVQGVGVGSGGVGNLPGQNLPG